MENCTLLNIGKDDEICSGTLEIQRLGGNLFECRDKEDGNLELQIIFGFGGHDKETREFKARSIQGGSSLK